MLEQSQSQAVKQGVVDARVEHLNRFRRGMADLSLRYNPVAQDVEVLLMDSKKDIYGDTYNEHKATCVKRVVIIKSPDMSYVQDMFDDFSFDLVESDSIMPFVVQMTETGLPRPINHDDRLRVGDMLYSVSRVAPANRYADGLLRVLVYPERNDRELDKAF